MPRMTRCNSQSFITEPTARLLWRNSVPMIGAILALFAYDLLESTLLAFQNESILAGFGFTLPITAAMSALAIGLSIRTNNKIVHCNCTEKSKLSQQISNSLFISTTLVLFFSCLFCLLNQPLLSLTGNLNWLNNVANIDEAQSQSSYMDIRYLGWVFIAVIWQVNAILRALGWMKLASGLMLTWALCKSVLAVTMLTPQSPFFSNNLENLAMVHIISDSLFTAISLWYLRTKVTLERPQLTAIDPTKITRKKDSFLVVLQQFITPVSMAALTAIAANIDTSYVAALALLFRLEVLFLLLPMVLTTSMPAIIGANFWLGHRDRVKKLYVFAFSAIALFQLFIALIAYSQGYLLSSFICPHDAISLHLENYLNWVPWGYGAAGIAIVFQSCLNAKNKTLHATIIGVSHRLIFVLPLTAFGALAFNEFGFYQGLMFGHLGAIIPVIFLMKRFGFIKYHNPSMNIDNPLEGIKHE